MYTKARHCPSFLSPLSLCILLNKEAESIVVDVMSPSNDHAKLATDQIQLRQTQVRHQIEIIQNSLELHVQYIKVSAQLVCVVHYLSCSHVSLVDSVIVLKWREEGKVPHSYLIIKVVVICSAFMHDAHAYRFC